MIESFQALALRQAHVDQLGVQGLDVGEDEQLLDGGVVAHVAIKFGVRITPLAGGLAEESDVEQVGFGGVGDGGLGGGDLGRDEVLFDRVGVDAVVELGEGAIEVPRQGEAAAFVFFETLEFLDEVNLELGANSHAKLEGKVAMGVGAAVASGAGAEADGSGFLHPFLHAEFVAVEPSLTSNYGEFAGIKLWVVDGFPDAKEFDGVPIPQPVGDEEVAVLGLEHVGEGDEVAFRGAEDGDFDSLNFDGGFGGLFHRDWFQENTFLTTMLRSGAAARTVSTRSRVAAVMRRFISFGKVRSQSARG